MTTPDFTDDELMALLGEAVAESDAVSDRRMNAAKAAFAWRNIDDELAELLHDSALEPGAAVRSGSHDEPRSLSFSSRGLALEVEVDGTVLMGQVLDADLAGAVVRLQRTGVADREVDVDSAGFFRFDDVDPGPIRLVASSADWRLVSPWVVI